jgi:FkbM family methyltransferase
MASGLIQTKIKQNKMYSQSNEESVILDYFKDFTGTFLSIGENDGVTFSNVRALAERNWKGVMVEPSPKAYEKLKALYNGHKGFYIYPYAISSHNGKAMLQESGPLCSASDVGLVSTFHSQEKQRFEKSVRYDPVEVTTFRWKTFLNRLRIKEFDMISLDVEGSELDILPEMDLSKTSLIVIEWNGKENLKTEYEKYLEGFKLIYTSPENLIYAR